jgi:hypothetical protein
MLGNWQKGLYKKSINEIILTTVLPKSLVFNEQKPTLTLQKTANLFNAIATTQLLRWSYCRAVMSLQK